MLDTAERSDPLAASGATESVPVGLAQFGADGTLRLTNAAGRKMLSRLSELGSLALEAAVRQASGQTLLIAGRDGTVYAVTPERHEDGTVLVSLLPQRDVARLESIDALTGLVDRAGFIRQLEAQLAGDRPVALMLLDLDRFKAVNDSLGHSAGDELLRLVARRMRSSVRGADVIARLGGDEFAVAMATTAEVSVAAERLVEVISRPFLIGQATPTVGVSVGLAFSPQHGRDPTALLRAADLALYQSKAGGRGRVTVFNDELERRAKSRGELTDDLRRAVPLCQLELHFQPQTNLATHEITGFEALVRWRHPTRGLIPPAEFIPLAEESGLILPIGEWVLNEACRQAANWPRPIPVAVNVSPRQLYDPAWLPRAVTQALLSSGLPAWRLDLEITESALANEAEVIEALTRVRAIGVTLSMDDFGTGYSSLSQLRRLPFGKLKIDRSFVVDLQSSSEAIAMVRAIAGLGQSLGLTVVAEGVEQIGQQDICRDSGCESIQGYLVSKPVPGEQVADLIGARAGPGQQEVGVVTNRRGASAP